MSLSGATTIDNYGFSNLEYMSTFEWSLEETSRETDLSLFDANWAAGNWASAGVGLD